jgi:hypothetical protein
MSAWIADRRPPEAVPGGPHRPGALWIESKAGRCGWYQIDGSVEAGAEAYDAIIRALEPSEHKFANLTDSREQAQESAKKWENAWRRADERLRIAMNGGRFFGRVLCVVTDNGVWLQDPEKRDKGFGLRFASLAHVWREFPDLRPVSWDGGDLILESFAMQESR